MADRQVFVYKGQEYSLSASLSPEEAKAKILAHLGEQPSKPASEAGGGRGMVNPANVDPNAAPPSNASAMPSMGTTDDFLASAKGVGAALGDVAVGLGKIPLAAIGTVGAKIANPSYNTNELWDAANASMNDMAPSFASPETAQTTGYKGVMKPFELLGEGIDYLGKKGYELTGSRDVEGAIRLGANFLPIPFLGKATKAVSKGAAALDPTLRNVGKKPDLSKVDAAREARATATPPVEPVDAGTAAFQDIVNKQTEGWTEPLRQSPAGLNGVVDQLGAMGREREVAAGEAQQRASQERQAAAQKALEERQAALEYEVKRQTALEQQAAMRQRQESAPTGFEEWQANKNVNEATASAEQLKQMNQDPNAQGFLDFNDFGNNDPMARMPNMRIDENGMPIRADLSMEAQNLENPLQMNMWGDELGPALDQQRSLTEAIDSMPPGAARDRGIEMLSGVPKPSFAASKRGGGSQRGAIDPKVFEDLYNFGKSVIRNSEGLLLPLYHGSETEFHSIKGSKQGGALGNGTYLAVRPEYASMYAEGQGGNVHQVYANITRPLEIKGPGDPMVNALVQLGKTREQANKIVEKAYDEKGYITNEVRALAVKQGYDGIVQYRGDKPSEVVAFKEDQVKSALSPEAKKLGNQPSGRPIGPRSQQGSQTILTDLGLGVYNTVKAGVESARTVLGAVSGERLGKDAIPADVPVENILQAAQREKDSGSWNALEAGNTMRAAKSGATWVRDTWEIAQNAIKRSEVNVRNYVSGFNGAERATRMLSKQETLELAALMKDEMFSKQQYTPEQMSAAGFTAKQLGAYAKIREMQAAALEALNFGRQKHGKEPITAQEAYLTSAWQGEVKMRVTDSKGNLVYYLAGNSERAVKKQLAALQKEYPEYQGGAVERLKQSFNGRDVESAYSIMADAIGRDNPEFQKIQQWFDDYQATTAHGAMGTEKHFEPKSNIRGFVGDRPGTSPHSEAVAMLQKQMDFAKESFHWAALQDAATKMAPIFQDTYIRDNHPNNLSYVQEQLRMAAGANEGAFARGVNDGIRGMGFTPAQVFGGAQMAKSWFMFQKLGFNLGYGIANLAQLPYTIPHLLDIGKQIGGFNPARSLAVAHVLTIPMAGAHYGRQYAGLDLVKNAKDGGFYKEMFDYAEQNGVTGRSIVDEAPLDAGPLGRAANLTTSAPETIIRSFAFSLFADALKQTGKMNNMDVFKEAERRTNLALGDFRETEKAPIFSRMGNVGNILNTLQTYGINYYQQMNYFTREVGRGNYAPLAAMLAVQYSLAGVSGMPGASDLMKGWDLVKGMLPNSAWSKVGDFDPKIWGYEHLGVTGVDGVASTLSGVSINSRVSAPAGSEMLQAPGGPLIDAAKQAGSVAQLAMNPLDPVQQAETAMRVLPTGLSGMLETGAFRDQTSVDRGNGRMYFKTNDLHKQDAGYVRSPAEESLRSYGFRSNKEVAERDISWNQQKYKIEAQGRKRSFSDEFFYAVTSGNTAKAKEIESNYTSVYGTPLMDADMKKQIEQKYLTDMERMKINSKNASPKELIRLSKINKILKEYQ